jgi:CHAT domain-containing protein
MTPSQAGAEPWGIRLAPMSVRNAWPAKPGKGCAHSPAQAVGDERHVFIVPEGPFHGLPWRALPDGANAYLVEHTPTIHVLDAERDLLEREAPRQEDRILAIGGADFDDGALDPQGTNGDDAAPIVLALSTRAVLHDCSGTAPLVYPPLPGTAHEVRSIERIWRGARVLEGRDASESAFKQLAPGNAVLHLATHGIVLEDTCAAASAGTRGVGGVAPLEDASHAGEPNAPAGEREASPWVGRRVLLAFAGANHAREHEADENEGLLTADEVATLDLRDADWVVLSACRSGVGDAWAREGVLGMRRAFRLAGARAVIASEWAVDDDATQEWMEKFYEARRDGAATASEAAQRASAAFLQVHRARGRGTHPFAWAAFTATGD